MKVEFRLSMPGCPSWNGAWSGDGRNYSVVRVLAQEDLSALFNGAPECRRSWSHAWSDGWVAQISARVVGEEDLPPSDGFHGYEWMIDNILRTGSPHGEVTS